MRLLMTFTSNKIKRSNWNCGSEAAFLSLTQGWPCDSQIDDKINTFDDYLEKSGLSSDLQFCFRSSHATADLFSLKSELTELLGIFTGLVLLDLYCLLYQKLWQTSTCCSSKTYEKTWKHPWRSVSLQLYAPWVFFTFFNPNMGGLFRGSFWGCSGQNYPPV